MSRVRAAANVRSCRRAPSEYPLERVDAQIHPLPTDDEQAAILEALSRSRGDPERPSVWWRTGVEENLDADAEGDAPYAR